MVNEKYLDFRVQSKVNMVIILVGKRSAVTRELLKFLRRLGHNKGARARSLGREV